MSSPSPTLKADQEKDKVSDECAKDECGKCEYAYCTHDCHDSIEAAD